MMNGKLYIGKTNDIEGRWHAHCSEAKTCRKPYPLYYAMKKHGIQHFKIEMLEEFEDENKCFRQEEYWIEFFKTNITKYGNDFGYNLSAGGEGPAGYEYTYEQKRKRSVRQTGDKNSFYGKTHSKKSRKRISNARKGTSISDDTKKKISAKLKGVPKTDETRAKMSAAFTGRVYDKKARENMSKAKRGKPNYNKRGSKHHNAKAKEYEVIEIRMYWKTSNDRPTDKILYLAEKYGLTKSSVKQIVYGKTWKHLI